MKRRDMTDVERRAAAKAFADAWRGRGDEKQDAQNFWRQLLQSVYGVEQPESDVAFEFRVKNDQTGSTIFIDAYIYETAVLIEQKGSFEPCCGVNRKMLKSDVDPAISMKQI